MKKIIVMLLSFVALNTPGVFATIPRSNTQYQVQSLYKQITNELVGIRKDFINSQPRVYTLLDQIDKMYNVTKTLYQKKQNLESQINNTNASLKKLNEENKTLKAELNTAKQSFDATFKQLELTHKQLETEKEQVAQHSKETHALQGKLAQIESEKEKKTLDEKIKENVTKSVEAEVATQLKTLAEHQSLCITPSSASITPR